MKEKIHDSARCPDCKKSLGQPCKVVTMNDEEYTLYNCSNCKGKWYRSHHI